MPRELFQADPTKYKSIREKNAHLSNTLPPSVKATKRTLIGKLNALGRWSKTFIGRICSQERYKLSSKENSSTKICTAEIKCRNIYIYIYMTRLFSTPGIEYYSILRRSATPHSGERYLRGLFRWE